jgi:hypothetical protein
MRPLIQQAEAGDQSVLPALRRLLDDNPEIWQRYGDIAKTAEETWLNAICGSQLCLKESMVRKLEELRHELTDNSPSPLIRLLAHRVAVCWLQVHYADLHVTRLNDAPPVQFKVAARFLDQANRRYLLAIKTLATVKKLLRPLALPAVLPSRLAKKSNASSPGGNRLAFLETQACTVN